MGLTLKIMIVDDELNIRKTLALGLEAEGHQVVAVSNDKDALIECRATRFDMCFLDMRLGLESGLDLLPKLLEISPWLRVVVITAHASIDNVVEAMRRGAFDYIEKPFTSTQIYAATRKVQTVVALELRVQQLEEELAKDRPDIELRSESTVMQKALNLARSAASANATILITGENGTGKTLLAKTIHSWSPRAKRPFATISCPSLSGELLESELFGHVKGAFTGALKSNPGRIAACEGGTLFLDEIGDMPLGLQAKLLRFLQEKEYEHVGESITRRADVRVLAATNVKLKEAVKSGRFREDLFYRLNVIQIEMPPLRERREDIPLLAEKCLITLKEGKKILGFTQEAMNRLCSYEWPGNIRELRNTLERAVILCHGSSIEVGDLIIDESSHQAKTSSHELNLTLEQVEEQHIRRVLASTRAMDQAAKTLGIDTVTLWRKRKRYGL